MDKYNNELRKIDTPHKAYLLGFIYGDGCITKYFEKKSKIRHQTKISVSIKDEKLIKQIHGLFPFFSLGYFDYSKYNKNSSEQIYLVSRIKNVYLDLKYNGVYPNKSYLQKENLRIPSLKNDLYSHFIRGFFDADGSVFLIKNRPNLLRCEIGSTSLNFISDLKKYLSEVSITTVMRVRNSTKFKRQTFYTLSILKSSEILKFKEFIYYNSTLYLKRKKEKFDNFIIYDKFTERNIICPKCSSKKTIKNGIRKPSIRYKCTECNLGFSIKL